MKRSAIFGGVIWSGLAVAAARGWDRLTTIELLFLLAPLVVVPLGLELCGRLIHEAGSAPATRFVRTLQMPAALCTPVAFWFAPGKAGAILALPWLCMGGAAGVAAARALLRGGYRKLETACMIASFFYLPVGCLWLLASRLGLAPMGFQEPIVLLTAVHFHFAGFAAPLLALAAWSSLKPAGPVWRRVFAVVAAGVLSGPGLLAAGFVIGPRLKLAMALLVACSEVGLSLFFLATIPHLQPRLAQVFVAISAASVLLAMLLAAIWAIGEFPLQPFVHLNEMARFHGAANAIGFVVCGLLGWTLSTCRAAGSQEEQQ